MPTSNARHRARFTARERHWFVGAGLLFSLGILVGSFVLLRWERAIALEAEAERGKLLTAVLESHVSRTLSSVEHTFDTVAALLESGSGRTASDDPNDISQRLQSIVQSSTYLRSLTVAAPGGAVLAASRPELRAGRIDLAALGFGREIIGTLEPGKPLEGRDLPAAGEAAAPGMYAMPFARAATAGGKPYVLLAMVNPSVMFPDYRAALGNEANFAAVFDYQGRVLGATANAAYALGGEYPALPMFAQLQRDVEFGRFHTGAQDNGHVVNFRSTRRYPVVAMTAMSHARVLSAWSTATRNTLWMGAAAAGFVLLYTILLHQVMLNREKMQRELTLAKEAAEQATAARGVFLSTMSHEIRTPMNAVIGMSGLLRETTLDPDQEACVQAVQQAATALLGIIDDVLDFSRIDAGMLTIDALECDLRAVVQGSVDVLAARAAQKGLRLDCSLDPALPARVSGDAGRLRQILLNLLGNAVKFTASGSIALCVRPLTLDATCCMVRFEVRDSGIGIRPEAMATLFAPFTQADGSVTREYGGSGLGLSICKRLVELMDGRIGVVSEFGRGSTFWFELALPLVQEEPAPAARPRVRASEGAASAPGRQRILLVEDNAMNQLVALRQLALSGYDADVVNNGQEALAALAAADYALVLMDCQMPLMDGFETTRRIRSSEAAGATRVPIVAMTANAMQGDRERCLEAGMDDYIAKPIMRDQLAALLARRLAGSAGS